jgi:holo-[acyl-carrier protein] synthase
MILGIGTDLVDARRLEKIFEKDKEAFLEKFFAPSEQAAGNKRLHKDRHLMFYATRFAAKEACAKALGTGIQGGVNFKDMVVSNDDLGKPMLHLFEGAKTRLESLASARGRSLEDVRIDLSLSDEYPFCIAFVTISME